MNFNIHVPLNSLSLGQTAISCLYEIFSRGLTPSITVIGQPDLTAQTNLSQDFVNWINKGIEKGAKSHKKSSPTLKLWHIQNSLESFSNKQVLCTFHETDQITAIERNILENQDRVVVTNDYTANVFRDSGLDNVSVVPLGFDSRNIYKTNKTYFSDDRITVSISGKFEHRKLHAKFIKAFIRKYGNSPKVYLNAAIYNPFLIQNVNGQVRDLNPEIQANLLGNKRFFNVKFYPYFKTNADFNDFLNAADVAVEIGTEGFGLCGFQSCALGKHLLGINAAGVKMWADHENAVLLNPSGKVECYDGVFFHKNAPTNQGNFYDLDEDVILEGLDKAIQRVQKDRVNHAGLKLQEKFHIKNTVDKLLSEVEKIS